MCIFKTSFILYMQSTASVILIPGPWANFHPERQIPCKAEMVPKMNLESRGWLILYLSPSSVTSYSKCFLWSLITLQGLEQKPQLLPDSHGSLLDKKQFKKAAVSGALFFCPSFLGNFETFLWKIYNLQLSPNCLKSVDETRSLVSGIRCSKRINYRKAVNRFLCVLIIFRSLNISNINASKSVTLFFAWKIQCMKFFFLAL